MLTLFNRGSQAAVRCLRCGDRGTVFIGFPFYDDEPCHACAGGAWTEWTSRSSNADDGGRPQVIVVGHGRALAGVVTTELSDTHLRIETEYGACAVPKADVRFREVRP